MKRKIPYIVLAIFIVTLIGGAFMAWHLHKKPAPLMLTLREASFAGLPGWNEANTKKSLSTFQISCKTFLRQDPERDVGSQQIPLKVKDWYPACREALTLQDATETQARHFFQRWFKPVAFYDKDTVHGLFTGYYQPLLHGSLTKTDEYNVPLYGLPSNLVTINLGAFSPDLANRRIIARIENNQVLPFYTRAEINKGKIKDKAPVLVWINSHIDRVFLEIQGSGIVELPNGERLYVGYAGENGATYTPIAKVLIDRGIMTKDNASMQRIRAYLEAHPKEILPVINRNKSFVFFQTLNHTAAMGAQGVALTPGYSLAVDRKWIPLGTPLWLDTTRPNKNSDNQKPLQRLMIAQDTGGAIRGVVRGDVFWGAGDRATYIAGHMKNEGRYWLLLPRHAVDSLPKKFV
ncbi:Membrane-bound lytic murein transglycosylase [Legionella beliardensis]|uniref:Membrane-bound lytic murein transglycosylase A n=1 Tax=Legionella beliardensis TaxID=91822 RepID=A0A378I0T9_9GAMM|nr:MltA domain-containing protein [Legionella beliardensis]STX28330.1 Membrane-bound lytic murein transglycosylase [Legionella beliardensis]